MKLSRVAMLAAGLSALIFGVLVLAPSASAACPAGSPAGATCGNTIGTANSGAGNASVLNIADLKTNGQNGTLICTGSPATSCNYDDDPAPNADNHFNVVPNLDDNPLQWANKYVFINNPSGVLEVEKTISAIIPGVAGGPATYQTVFDDQVAGSNILSGAACTSLLGNAATVGTVANGLVTTGQKTATEIQNINNGCQQNTIGVLVNPFPISKHLPPGVYRQCAVLTSSGSTTSPFCTFFKILPVTGYQTDVNTINYGTLVQNVKSIFAGNFTMDSGTANPGTIAGIGNTSPKLLVAYSCMYNDFNNTPTQTSDDKLICSWFDVQINRADVNGNIIATNHVDYIAGGAHPLTASPFGADADLTTGTQTGTAPFAPVCLEPNENLKLDFSVTPTEVLYSGTYSGLVRLTVTNTGVPSNCTPTLGQGESAAGDSDSVNNNLPGQLVAQAYP